MKQKFLSFCMAALLFVGLVGCEKPEQSELDFADLQDTAYVMGHITYSLGQDMESNDYVAEVIKPAIGRKIYVEVPLSSYSAGAQGNKIYTGVVDSLGNVKIAVPVKSEGISGATLRYEEFTAERAEYLKMENGKPVFDVRMNKFETPAAIASLPILKPGTNSIGEEVDLRYAHTIIDMKDYDEKAVFTGKLRLPYEVSFHTGAYKAAANCQVEITIQDGEDVAELTAAKAPKYTYGCVTNEAGEFSLNLPIKNLREGFCIVEAKVVPLADAAFVHYTDVTGKSVKVAGAYKLRTDWEAGVNINDVAEVIDGITCSIGECPLKFVPGYNNGIADPVLPAAWEDNLAGWVFGEKEFASMTATAKLTGSVKLAAETAYGVGTYTTSAQSLKIKGSDVPYNKEFAVLANANGEFALEIPIEQEGTTPASSWTVELIQPTSIAFTHYTELNKSIVIKEGTYSEYKKVRSIEAEWNELGDFYYSFAPTGTVDTYVTNLAGWVLKDGYDATNTVTAKFFVTYEKEYAVGDYKGAEGRRASVSVVYPDETLTFVAPVAADGTFSVAVPVKDQYSAYTADDFKLIDDENDAFVHYTKKGQKNLSGKYTVPAGYNFETKDADWNNKWTFYYKFAPTATVETFHDKLAGWFKKEGFEKSATAKGKAYFAKEKSYGIGEYAAAANEVVTVTVPYPGAPAELQVPVKADGSFSVAVPLKDVYDEYDLTVSAASVEVDDFVHYKAHGKTQTLEGTYAAGDPLKTVDAAWNDMGTYYFTFTPKNTVETYTKYLAGWQKFDAKYSNTDKDITGSIMLPIENGFWVGAYAPYANEKVELSYTLAGAPSPFKMVVLTDADGAFTCTSYREFGDQEPAVSVKLCKAEVDDYVHYYHVTSPSTMKVEGTYSNPVVVNDKAWNIKGVSYYKFTPKSIASTPEWPEHNLLGWYKLNDAEGKATFKLYAQKAFETSTPGNHEADWEAAGSGVMATVTLSRPGDSKTFNLLVSGDKLSLNNVPFMQKVEEGDPFSVSISLVHSSTMSGYPKYSNFKHYPDQSLDSYKTITGTFTGVAFNESWNVSSGTVEIKKSAKMKFNPEGSVDGWALYNWNSIINDNYDE